MSHPTEVGQCYVSPKLTLRRTARRGYGLFAQEPIQPGELLLVIGGEIVNPQQLAELDHTFSIQDEEVCYDYAMTDGTPYDEFEYLCGSPCCRGKVRGDDWQRPELWTRYAGHFSPYLQRRIDRLKVQQPA